MITQYNNVQIEVINENLFGFDFSLAKELKMLLPGGDYKGFSKQSWSFSQNGWIVLNTKEEDYEVLKQIFSILAMQTNEELERTYLELRDYFGDKTLLNIDEYPLETDKKHLTFFEFIPIELQRRQYANHMIEKGIVRFWTRL